ncbi:hypothetical protein NADFUDRAFT_84213 [Nadsonia fulvescens var. elongata DSM 6958]|uniref:Uncharacterized protein n=1 Tax=Nadsonia fulvescens var. elongata DSM 6958 TaxID=857566 RepID=A0A1E3PDS7_9ASCO|nr:hypothetical protein NADFUDRAFT_84213 [Nadsonia fulvescens var. elongata DSM 6958]
MASSFSLTTYSPSMVVPSYYTSFSNAEDSLKGRAYGSLDDSSNDEDAASSAANTNMVAGTANGGLIIDTSTPNPSTINSLYSKLLEGRTTIKANDESSTLNTNLMTQSALVTDTATATKSSATATKSGEAITSSANSSRKNSNESENSQTTSSIVWWSSPTAPWWTPSTLSSTVVASSNHQSGSMSGSVSSSSSASASISHHSSRASSSISESASPSASNDGFHSANSRSVKLIYGIMGVYALLQLAL